MNSTILKVKKINSFAYNMLDKFAAMYKPSHITHA